MRGLKILNLILFDTYGERDSRSKFLNILLEACATGKHVSTTAGEQEIDLVHIDDVCAGVEAGIKELDKWDANNGVMKRGLGSGKPIKIKELMVRVALQIGKPLFAKIGERDYRAREVMKAYRGYVRPAGWMPTKSDYHK